MKTRCPACQTVFRVAPEQLKVRAGKVRCGECSEVFNALDYLLDEDGPSIQPDWATQVPVKSSEETNVVSTDFPEIETSSLEALDSGPVEGGEIKESEESGEIAENASEMPEIPEDAATQAEADVETATNTVTESTTPAQAGNVRPVPAGDLILPRETSQIPGYSKWAEGVMSTTSVSAAAKATRWPFIAAASMLLLLLAGQMGFFFRSEIATVAPSLRPVLEAYASLFDAGVPLPRHVELISIEASDLQSDPAHGNLLVLNATLRNRANYAQDYPAVELSLTDTQDAAIARRVFLPADYLSDEARATPFVANGDVAVRLWIEAKEISAAGYRLYVFYP